MTGDTITLLAVILIFVILYFLFWAWVDHVSKPKPEVIEKPPLVVEE